MEGTITDGFQETKAILKKMLDNGMTHKEITTLMKFSAYDGMYNVIMRLEDPDSDGLVGYPGWTLLETNEDYEPTDREVNGLNQSLLWVLDK